MVNVSSPLPFNLHNKPRALIDIMTQGSHLSSSSRSASTSTFRDGQSPIQPHLNSRPLVHTRSELRLTPVNYAGQSRSRSASQSSISSGTSSRKGERRAEEVGEPSGILGVRLVRGLGTGYRYSAQRGRAKGKQVDEAGTEPAILNMSDHVQSVAESQVSTGYMIFVPSLSRPTRTYTRSG